MRSACLEPKVQRIQGLGLFAFDKQSKGDCDFLKKAGAIEPVIQAVVTIKMYFLLHGYG